MSDKKTTSLATVPFQEILESISDGVFTVDTNWRITSFNRAASEILGIPRSEAEGSLCSEIFRSDMCQTSCALKRTLSSGKPVVNKLCYVIDADGNRRPVSISTAVLRSSDGKIIGGAETFRDLSEVEELKKKLEGKVQIGDFVSRSPSMKEVFDLVRAVSGNASNVLIQGDTGTGKELLARAIHGLGERASKPFVAVNCAALPDTLLESELFGYKRGAFTGASRDKPGRFAMAEGGTLFLDEIGEISPAMQVKLLRVLQTRIYEPLGAVNSETADVRIISATNRNLRKMVSDGSFREDLFYRINVVRIEIPPLARRKEDIPLLTEHFMKIFNRRMNREIEGFSPEAYSALIDYDWPGNVRELENAIERAFALCGDIRIELRDLPEEIRTIAPRAENSVSGKCKIQNIARSAEKRSIAEALERNGFNRAKTARELGIHTSTLFRKMKLFDIDFSKKNI